MAETGNPFENFTLKSALDTPEDDCKGIFFRATTSLFMAGEIIKSTIPQKLIRIMLMKLVSTSMKVLNLSLLIQM